MKKVIETRQEVIDFLQVDEYLDGKGFGFYYDNSYGDYYDYGNGFGNGSGFRYANSDWNGFCYGNGNGFGNCDGSGNGYGSENDYGNVYWNVFCYGKGNGSGSGDSYGNGDSYDFIDNKSVKVVNGMTVHIIDNIPTLIYSVHGNFAKGLILEYDLTTNPCYIAKCGNYFAHGGNLEDAFHYAREKYDENTPIEERIARFNCQYPDRNRKVPAKELFNWHHTLTGSCLMGRKHFCEEHGIDYENGEYSVNEFIQLTKNAYNGNVIRQLEDS